VQQHGVSAAVGCKASTQHLCPASNASPLASSASLLVAPLHLGCVRACLLLLLLGLGLLLAQALLLLSRHPCHQQQQHPSPAAAVPPHTPHTAADTSGRSAASCRTRCCCRWAAAAEAAAAADKWPGRAAQTAVSARSLRKPPCRNTQSPDTCSQNTVTTPDCPPAGCVRCPSTSCPL
jgi:hypothetical protein